MLRFLKRLRTFWIITLALYWLLKTVQISVMHSHEVLVVNQWDSSASKQVVKAVVFDERTRANRPKVALPMMESIVVDYSLGPVISVPAGALAERSTNFSTWNVVAALIVTIMLVDALKALRGIPAVKELADGPPLNFSALTWCFYGLLLSAGLGFYLAGTHDEPMKPLAGGFWCQPLWPAIGVVQLLEAHLDVLVAIAGYIPFAVSMELLRRLRAAKADISGADASQLEGFRLVVNSGFWVPPAPVLSGLIIAAGASFAFGTGVPPYIVAKPSEFFTMLGGVVGWFGGYLVLTCYWWSYLRSQLHVAIKWERIWIIPFGLPTLTVSPPLNKPAAGAPPDDESTPLGTA